MQKKNQLLCISPINYCETTSYIQIDSECIASQASLKLLGFTFGNRPGIAAHLESMWSKYSARAWAIRRLKKVKVSVGDLVKIYCALVRPILEFACVIYHCMATKEQADEIERLQRNILKVIYGVNVSYSVALERSGISRLDERRDELVLKFALKCYKSESFNCWFPPNFEKGYNLRKTDIVLEQFTTRNRMRNNPVYYLRRKLNEFFNAKNDDGRIGLAGMTN